MKNSLMQIGKWLAPGVIAVASISVVLGTVGCGDKDKAEVGTTSTPAAPATTYVTPGTSATPGASGTTATPGPYVTPGTSGASGTGGGGTHAGPTPGPYVTPGTR